jgi:hypothetical protein
MKPVASPGWPRLPRHTSGWRSALNAWRNPPLATESIIDRFSPEIDIQVAVANHRLHNLASQRGQGLRDTEAPARFEAQIQTHSIGI